MIGFARTVNGLNMAYPAPRCRQEAVIDEKKNHFQKFCYFGNGRFLLVLASTGILKYKKLYQLLAVSPQSLPLARITTFHEWSGLLLIIFLCRLNMKK